MVYLVFAMFVSGFLFYAFGRSAPSWTKSFPAFFFGLLAGIVAALIQTGISGLLGASPSSVVLTGLRNVVFDALVPFALLACVNALFFAYSLESGWVVPQFFGLFSIYVPFSLLRRYAPADSLFFFFYAFATVLAVFLVRASFLRFADGDADGMLGLLKVFLLPFAAAAAFAVISALWFFAMPASAFVAVSSCFCAVSLVLSLALGMSCKQR